MPSVPTNTQRFRLIQLKWSITGRSRGLPKPNYFPLLPPISPADAKRFCRITGKSYGLPTHHYIPVLLGVHTHDKSKCRITTASGFGPHHYTAGLALGEKRKHVILKDYRYVFPMLEGESDQQKALRDLLSTKEPLEDEEEMKFVYTVEERRCSLVFPARLEAAVRDGDVRDVMLSRDCDTVFLRLKQGKNVSVDFKDLNDFEHLYDGLGPRDDVLREREKHDAEARKRKKKRANGLNYAKKIFEDKEKAADKEEQLRKSTQLKLRSIKEELKEEKILDWKNIDLGQARSGSIQLSIASENLENLVEPITMCNWNTIKRDVGKVDGTPIVDRIPVPIRAEPNTVDIEASSMGAVTSPISENTGGFEVISIIKPLSPLNVEPDDSIQEALMNLTSSELEETANVKEKMLSVDKQVLEILPRIEEIPKIIKSVGKGKTHDINNVKGLKIDIDSAQRFITGRTVQTPTGPIFVPGQTLSTPNGASFVPGFTVHTPDGPILIPGQIMKIPDGENSEEPVFIAGQTLETKCGLKFVHGQTIHTSEGAKFIAGQTVFTDEGPKFVAGQVVTPNNFIPGQTIITENGPRFMPGQTVTNHNGEHVFVPGQSVKIDENWEFIPGQCITSLNGESMFVPGKTMQTSEGLRFVAGQNVTTTSGENHFVPGMSVKINEGFQFIPGTALETPQGPKFVQGMIMKTTDGEKFVPGCSIVGSNGFEFASAKTIKDIIFFEAGPVGISVDPRTANEVSHMHQQEIFGHMIQTDHGVEFVPESVKKIPDGQRIVPGQLVRGGKDGPRFVPGLMTEEGFLPGQLVMTEKGDQFVPGQVVETSTGPKFVPGRMVETRTGQKFVPGQTIETADGPRFVPGQIVQTKVGPTFIPGQVISTEDEGSRFVPGQVVDTPDGPRFVPGRVVESGELGVTFVPGQIVQTEEGPRFVAPDLMDTPEGELEFSVQGFEVTPEELALLRPSHVYYNGTSQHHIETSIDARMLRQLSEAGMTVGRKTMAHVPKVDVDVDPTAIALEHALVIAEKLGLHGDSAVKMAQVVSTISQLAHNIVKQDQLKEKSSLSVIYNGNESSALTNGHMHQNGHDEKFYWLHEAIKAAIATAVLAITEDNNENVEGNGDIHYNQSFILSSISEAFNVVLRQGSTGIDQSVNDVLKILLIPHNRIALCQGAVLDLLESSSNKIDILKSTIVRQSLKNDVVLERLSAVLEDENGCDLLGSAFRIVSQSDPELVTRVLEKVSQEVDGVVTENEAAKTVHKAIVDAVRESSEIHVRELLNDDGCHLRELILQAVGLARALGMSSTANSLLAVISDAKSTQALAGDKVTLDILKRLTVMRKLAEARPQFVSALRELTSDPEMARTDPHLRVLVRESAALMIVPEEAPLQSSADVPTALLNAENSLAIEEFLLRKNHKPSTIFMILKQGIQAVVPREASRAVLTGQVAYTVLDENGITRFEPLHVFNALKLNKPTAHRFSMYACHVAADDDYESDLTATLTRNASITSADSFDACINGRRNSSQDYSSSGMSFTKSDRTLGNSFSRENTPSFRRLSTLCNENNCERITVENFVVVKDYVSEEDDGFSVKVGDIVEAIEHSGDSSKRSRMDPELDIGDVGARLDNSAARHKLSIRPRRKHEDPRARAITRSNSDSNLQRARVRRIDGKEGWLPMSILMQTALSEDSSTLTGPHRSEDSQYRREAVVKELVETEEEFGRDLQQVVERYLKPLDNPGVPRVVRDNKEIIFTNLKQIADFHNTSFGRVLIEGVKYYADQPRMLGKTFLRLERDFDKHVTYCRDEPAAQEFLQSNNEVRDYFEISSSSLCDDIQTGSLEHKPNTLIVGVFVSETSAVDHRRRRRLVHFFSVVCAWSELSHNLGDDKSVSEHLKLPIQRINDYQLLLKELVKYSTRLGENSDDLQKALELMLGIPHRATDNKFISNIEGYKGHIHKLGRLLTHEWFTVIDKDGKSKERYLFLFKARILVCKVRRISEDRSVFVLKDIIRLPEVEVKDYPDDQRTFELHNPGASSYPITLTAHKDLIKSYWLKEIRQYSSDLVALAEHAADDLQLTEEKDTTDDNKLRVKPEGTKIDTPKPRQESSAIESKPEQVSKSTVKVEVPKSESTVASSAIKKGTEITTAEKTNENLAKLEEIKVKTIEESEKMSGRYSSSHYTASSKVVEEYSSLSSTRNGASSYVETSSSSMAHAERRASSSLYGTEKISDSSSTYESAVSTVGGGKSTGVDTKLEKLTLTATETGKPKFVKTIEGINVEPGECATFECTLESSISCRMQWFKDNKPLNDKLADRVNITSTDKSYKLEIKNVLESDSGIYTARAANGDGNATCTAQLIVENLNAQERRMKAEAKAPVFLVKLKDTELLENTYLRFMIKVKGDPNPDVKFFKDNVVIDSKHERVKIITEKADKGFYELVIPDVQKKDAGKYSCTATNQFGEVSSEATVGVTDEKTLFAGIPEGIFEPGSEAQFKWLRDGKPFDPEERFKVLFQDNEDTLALVFQHVKPEDAGLYTCVAQTNTGNISCSAELTVQGNVNQLLKEPSKPKLGSESKQSEVNAGGSAMLDLQVKGFPKPDIKWSKDGKEIIAGGRIKYLWEDEESLSLVIKNVTVEDSGTYTIRAKNELGEDTTYIELIVKSAPKITKKMTDTFSYIETDAKMTVQIHASPAPDVKWYKDGQLIDASERIIMKKEENDNYTLTLKSCRLEDIGSYSIVAKNEISQTSEFWNFDVKCPPKIKKNLGESRIINEGDTLTLRIEVETPPEPTVVWYKDTEVIKEDHRIKIVSEGQTQILQITGTVDIDAAVYKAEVSNKDGTTVDEVGIEVRSAPRFKKQMIDVIAKDGEKQVEFEVEVGGYPRPTLQWYINDVEITEEKQEFAATQDGDVHKLILSNVKIEHSGRYTCKLRNEYGKNASTSNLIVYCKPKIVKKLTDQKLKEGETLKLQVQISGTPDPNIKWFKDGQEVSADARVKITRDSKRRESYDLTLNLLKGSDGGVYEVRAENEMGSVTCKSKVIVLTKTENTTENIDELDAAKKVKEENILDEQHQAEIGPEGHGIMEKNKIEVIKGVDNDTITISVASTTEHEATISVINVRVHFTGPGERHTISKMKITKVECQEINTNQPEIEEIASYNYTLQEDKCEKPRNGILIEEYSEDDDKTQQLIVNRGISIVSISDDESTMKPLSRDISGDDIHSAEISQPKSNGFTDDLINHNGNTINEIIEDYLPRREKRYTETIIEECSINESLSGKSLIIENEIETKANKANIEESKLTCENSKLEELKEQQLSRQNSKLNRINSTESSKALIDNGDTSRRNSQQSSLINDEDDEDMDEKTKSLLNRIKRQRSVLEEILDKQAINADSQNSEIEAAPAIVSSDFEDCTIYATQSISFTIHATGLPRPDAKWFRDGKALRAADKAKSSQTGEKHTLTINKASEAETGLYQLVLTNKLGTTSIDAFIEVGPESELRAPRFKEPLANINVEINSTGTFQTVLTAEPIPEVVWLYEDNEISPDDERFTMGRTNKKVEDNLQECTFTLSISDCTLDDIGKYTIKAENKWGKDSCSASLDLLVQPKILEFKDLNAAVEELGKWEVIIKSNPKAELTWEKDGLILDDEERFGAEDDFAEMKYRFILKCVEYDDAGIYKVTAKNYLGEDCAQAELIPYTEPPEFIQELNNGSVRHDAAIKFNVEAKGIARPKITWLLNGDEIKNDERHTITTTVDDHVFSTLSIVNFDPTDEGELVCVATNRAGKAKTNCNLSMIRLPPTFDQLLPKSKQIEEGQPLELSIEVDGSPFPKVAWYKDGEKIIPDDHVKIETQPNGSTKLTIDKCTPIDCGAYKLIAKNNNGENISQCAVAVK
ncbi:hypothetical protein PV326_010858, partial [Microctonus aethiopoides]